jgi:hypothetical protein
MTNTSATKTVALAIRNNRFPEKTLSTLGTIMNTIARNAMKTMRVNKVMTPPIIL